MRDKDRDHATDALPYLNVTLADSHGCLRDPDRPYPGFPNGCPAPLKVSLPGIVFGELCGACPVQGEGVAQGREFSFYARYGTWNMEIEDTRRAHYRNFSGDDPWDGHMPPSVAFALIVSKLLWHVCGAEARTVQEIARDQSYRDWKGLRTTSDLFIVRLTHWLAGQDPSDYSESIMEMLNAVLWESKRRGWPEDWWEDPSVVLEAR